MVGVGFVSVLLEMGEVKLMATEPWDNEETEQIPAAVNQAWDGSVSYTFKGEGTFADPWLVVKAPSMSDLADMLEDKVAIKRAVTAGIEVDKMMKWASREASGGGGQGQKGEKTPPSGRTPGKPAGAQKHPDGEVKFCEHAQEMNPATGEPFGSMIYREGSKGGKVWKGFFCPLPQTRKDEQCKPVFV